MKNFPVEILERLYLHINPCEAHTFYLLDEDEVDMEKATHIRDAYDDYDEDEPIYYTVFRYTCSDGINRNCAIPQEQEWEPELTAEDLTEWQAASSGCGYYTFIGEPWLDS